MLKHLHIRRLIICQILLVLLLAGCSSQRKVRRFLDKQLIDAGPYSEFTGLLMVDAHKADTLFSLNSGRYFTPASTTKLFTLYAALKTLPERIPSLKYQLRGDTVHVLGTGDPSILHPALKDRTAIDFLQRPEHVVLHMGTLGEPTWGPGWAWDDFDRGYQVERTSLPLYGNVVRLVKGPDGPQVSPGIFRDSIFNKKASYRRSPERNHFFYNPSFQDTTDIPFTIDTSLTKALWEEATGRHIIQGKAMPEGPWEVLPGMASDTLYKEMMAVSDNFLAEQLMLMVSSTLSDSLSFNSARDYILKTYLPAMPSPPRWVDGSGLSRYNLISPESLVYLLLELYQDLPEERLFALLAKGGQKGTLEDWYQDPDGPYLFGKTGTLSNNHNLCGYLKTKSGKTVVFSFMNNHYRKPTHLIKSRMQRILVWVREHY